jgi:inorganic pyrophosphatase
VLEGDPLWADARDIGDVPDALVTRLRHYFATYKAVPGAPGRVTLHDSYGAARAARVVQAALEDYAAAFDAEGHAARERR